MTPNISPFLYPGPVSSVDKLSIVHLKRDLQTPTILRDRDDDNEGYTEGKVVNTRFGSFPHSTLISAPWGSQIRASAVDTGSRGRRGQPQENKRKRAKEEAEANAKRIKLENGDGLEGTDTGVSTPREDVEVKEAATGFIHLLPPTPENWTGSLPHRTQVVYTPDYSYILHRIRARPGKRLIEAGAGSGSFTHASARAVFSGYPEDGSEDAVELKKKRSKLGKVWSYEFHEQRHQKLVKELNDHGLDGVVEITHRDVCGEGFLVDGKSPEANSIFLDLPAPWLALPHLSRSKPPKITDNPVTGPSNGNITEDNEPFLSPLDPKSTAYICTFSPCIEQVTKTVSVMRRLGWVDIEMVEIAAKRLEIRRERVGLDNADQKGTLTVPASVDEAVSRLLEIEGTFKTYHANGGSAPGEKTEKANPNSKEALIKSLVEDKVYKDGRLIHRTESEIRTHTSYLVFAVLPVEWSAEDEKNAVDKWAVKDKAGEVTGKSRRQMKKAERQAKKDAETGVSGNVSNVVGEDVSVQPVAVE